MVRFVRSSSRDRTFLHSIVVLLFLTANDRCTQVLGGGLEGSVRSSLLSWRWSDGVPKVGWKLVESKLEGKNVEGLSEPLWKLL